MKKRTQKRKKKKGIIIPPDRKKCLNEHAFALSKIAVIILNTSFTVPGVREIIALYLLIPYITKDQLKTPENCKTPLLDVTEEFSRILTSEGEEKIITLDNLRHAICHSWVSKEDGIDGCILLDNRASCSDPGEHDRSSKTRFDRLGILQAHAKLLELHKRVIEIGEMNVSQQSNG